MQFPFLAACDLLFFMGPQIYYLLENPDLYKNFGGSSLSLFLIVCILFYSVALVGYYSSDVRFSLPHWHFDPRILIAGLFILSAIAVYGRVQLAALPDELKAMGQWTGLPVKYLFFATVGTLCIPLGVVLFFKYNYKIILIPLGLEFGSLITMVVTGGRRTPAVFAALMLMTGLWFSRRIKLPMGLIIAGGLIFFMFVTNVATYRTMLEEGNANFSAVVTEVFDIKKTIQKFTGQIGDKRVINRGDDLGNYVDLLNGVVCTKAAVDSFSYNYGVAFWNMVVHNWVPGQIVGHGVKNALKLDVDMPFEVAEETYKYNSARGSCIPGYAEIYTAFGILGVIMMFIMGKTARMIWEQALEGNLIAQTIHFALAPVYIRFGGGGIWPLLSGLFFWVIFLAPLYILAKRNASQDELLEVAP